MNEFQPYLFENIDDALQQARLRLPQIIGHIGGSMVFGI